MFSFTCAQSKKIAFLLGLTPKVQIVCYFSTFKKTLFGGDTLSREDRKVISGVPQTKFSSKKRCQLMRFINPFHRLHRRAKETNKELLSRYFLHDKKSKSICRLSYAASKQTICCSGCSSSVQEVLESDILLWLHFLLVPLTKSCTEHRRKLLSATFFFPVQ